MEVTIRRDGERHENVPLTRLQHEYIAEPIWALKVAAKRHAWVEGWYFESYVDDKGAKR